MSMPVLMSSRRTIMSGEVVTFSTAFEKESGAFGDLYEATGIFEVSASRDAVMVHHADCRCATDTIVLLLAIQEAEKVRRSLQGTWRGGQPSMYPEAPTPVSV